MTAADRVPLRKTRLAVAGGTGFLGGYIVRALLDARPAGITVLNRRQLSGPPPAGVTAIRGDLDDERSLRRLCAGADVLVHAASRVDGTLNECAAVNVRGTRTLLRAAAGEGVGRVIYISTTGVYEDGVHRGPAEDALPTRPASPASVTRLRAEKEVLAAGGTVIRPHLVYGAGDRWVVPAVAGLLRSVPAWIEGGRSRMSLIAADDLAGAVAALAVSPPADPDPPAVLHAGHPAPASSRELLTAVADALGLHTPSGDISLAKAGALLGTDRSPRRARLLSLLAVDHWYDCDKLWTVTGRAPGADLAAGFARHASWYQQAYGLQVAA